MASLIERIADTNATLSVQDDTAPDGWLCLPCRVFRTRAEGTCFGAAGTILTGDSFFLSPAGLPVAPHLPARLELSDGGMFDIRALTEFKALSGEIWGWRLDVASGEAEA